jgi:hypothetical protein
VCDSQIMRQRKGATIMINGEPKEVARREQSKGGMMGGWMVWISCARYPQQRRKGKKELVLTLLRKRDEVVRYSTPEVKEVFPAQLVLLGCGMRRLASGPSAAAVAARAVPARPASSPGSAIVAR